MPNEWLIIIYTQSIDVCVVLLESKPKWCFTAAAIVVVDFFFLFSFQMSHFYHRFIIGTFFFDFNSISVWFGILFGQAYKTFHCTNRCWWWWFMESIDYECICCPLLDLLISAIWYFDEANPVQDCIFLYENGRMSGWMLL